MADKITFSDDGSDILVSTWAGMSEQLEQIRVWEEEQKANGSQRRMSEISTSTEESIAAPNSCIMCNSPSANMCNRCKSSYYCSPECQKRDWASHKLLCKAFSTQPPRPSPAHKLAILFPESLSKPSLVWVPCTRMGNEEGDSFDLPDLQTLLGKDKPREDRHYIVRNPKRGVNLGSGIGPECGEGYYLYLIFRDSFLNDGSFLNRSIMDTVRLDRGTTYHSWSGPMLLMRQALLEDCEVVEDITLRDFRHVIDHFTAYNSPQSIELDGLVRQVFAEPATCLSPTTFTSAPPKGYVCGVEIRCYGDTACRGKAPYGQVEVSEKHPIFKEYETSPIAKLLDMPIRLWSNPRDRTWDSELKGHTMDGGANSNAVFLMMGCDPEAEGWGFAPIHWLINTPNTVLVVSDDASDISVDDVMLLCYFARVKLQPMFEEATGAGKVKRTKQEVLDFITPENMEKCREEMRTDLNAHLH